MDVPPAPKRIPQRTCVVCSSTATKRELLSIVRTPTGEVVLDPTGKANGRGAYLCHRVECWDSALKRDRLSIALKVKVSPEARQSLAVFAAGLNETKSPAGDLT